MAFKRPAVFRTGFSKVNTWRECNKKYEFSYVRNIQARRRPMEALRGTILHEMLAARDNRQDAEEVWLRYDVHYGAMFEEEREFYGEYYMEDIWRIYRGYVRTWRDKLWTVHKTEGLVRTRLTPYIEFEGHYDLLVAFDNRSWLVDRKTHKAIPDANERFSNFQLLLYAEAWNREHEVDDVVDGIIWDYLRTKAPTIPIKLKGGGLSRAKNIDTDEYTYRRALRDYDIDPAPYEYFLRELRERSVDKFYQRVPLPIPSKEMTRIVVDEFIDTADMIRHARKFPRTPKPWCHKCEFFKLCQAELAGINAKFIERSDYEPREERREVEAD